MAQNHHNQGQEDAWQGRTPRTDGRNAEEQRDYNNGYYHTKGEPDSAESKYRPPHGTVSGFISHLFGTAKDE